MALVMESKDTRHHINNCNACHARNYSDNGQPNGTVLTDIQFGEGVILTLCPNCLRTLTRHCVDRIAKIQGIQRREVAEQILADAVGADRK